MRDIELTEQQLREVIGVQERKEVAGGWNGPVNENIIGEQNYCRGLLVYTVDVGQMPPLKAEAYISRLKEQHKELNDRLRRSNIESIYIASRTHGTTVQYIELD